MPIDKNRTQQRTKVEAEFADIAHKAGILTYNTSTPKSTKQVMDERKKEILEDATSLNFEKVYSSMPNPPQEVIEESEFLTLIRNDFSTPYAAAADFTNAIFIEMKNKNIPKKTVSIDANRYFEFTLIEDGTDMDIFLVNTQKGTRRELGYDKIREELFSLFEELHAFSEWKNYKDYKYVLYDTSYQKLDGQVETEEEKQLRYKKIDEQYLKLKRDGFFTEDQLKVLYKLMHMDYDINCFSCPLYSVQQMYFLASIYAMASTNVDEKPKLENFLRSFNEFCSNNFKHQFTISEFSRLFEAANEGKIMDLINHPDFEIVFKLDYLLDAARDSLGGIYKYNLNNQTFIISVSDKKDLDGYLTETNWKIELEDPNPESTSTTLLYDSTIHEFDLHSEPLNIFTKAYYQKHKIQDQNEFIDVCMNEVRKAIQDENNRNNDMVLDLNDGSKLKISGIIYTEGSEQLIYGDEASYGCEVFLYKPNREPKLIYSDNSARSFHNAEKISNVIEAAGGLLSREGFFKEQRRQPMPEQKQQREPSIADQILGEPTKEDYSIDVAQEIANMYQKTLEEYNKTKNAKLKNTILLSNGNEIIFSPKSYFETQESADTKNKLQKKFGVKVEVKDNTGKLTTFFDIASTTKNGAMVPVIKGDLSKVAYYYRQVEGIKLMPDYEVLKQIENSIVKNNNTKTKDETIR